MFQSRTLKPWWGFAIVATAIITMFLQWEALGGWLTSILGFAPMFTGLGLTTHNLQLLDLGVWFTTPLGIWMTTAITSLVSAAILIKSFKWFVQIQWVMWYGFLLSYVLMIVFFIITPTSVFISRFNAAMAILAPNAPDYYHYVVNQATANGFVPVSGLSWGSTIFVIPIALTSLGWVGYTQEQAGEIQGASSLRNQLFINLGGGLFSTALMMILSYTFVQTVGQGWLAAAAYGNFITGTVSMPIPPWFSNLAAVLTDNPLLVFLMIVGILLNSIQIVMNVIVGWTRVAVAMSIDGVLPKFVSAVNERTHTPVNAHIIYAILGGVLYSYVYNFVPSFLSLTLAVTAVATLMYIGTSIGGAVFPWTRKETYDNSPIAKYKVGNVPVILICGIVAAGFSAWMLYYYLTVPGLGVANFNSELFMLGIFLAWTAYFFIRRWYLKRIGINLDLAYKEVPPV